MLRTLQEEYSQKSESLLELGQIVGFGEVTSTVYEMAFGVYNSPKYVSDIDDQIIAVKMLNNSIDNWNGDLKILGNSLK